MSYIRELLPADYPKLQDFLYHAIYQPPGTQPLPKHTIFTPEIFVYIENFGKPNDYGVLAEQGGQTIGMAWARIIPAYGNIDPSTTELAVSVLPEHRGQGIGTALLSSLFNLLRKHGHSQTSLSVQKANPAYRLYKRMGYKILRENDEDYILVKNLR
ncbi:MAG: GNAT family N-acetyltransferase [Defluviitaleaceae bacterium]|nr:GNAT family N-acetyltransferase [Defluviitaleaceae bacterium]